MKTEIEKAIENSFPYPSEIQDAIYNAVYKAIRDAIKDGDLNIRFK